MTAFLEMGHLRRTCMQGQNDQWSRCTVGNVVQSTVSELEPQKGTESQGTSASAASAVHGWKFQTYFTLILKSGVKNRTVLW